MTPYPIHSQLPTLPLLPGAPVPLREEGGRPHPAWEEYQASLPTPALNGRRRILVRPWRKYGRGIVCLEREEEAQPDGRRIQHGLHPPFPLTGPGNVHSPFYLFPTFSSLLPYILPTFYHYMQRNSISPIYRRKEGQGRRRNCREREQRRRGRRRNTI